MLRQDPHGTPLHRNHGVPSEAAVAKMIKIEDVQKSVTGCTGCQLHRTRTNAVPGKGDPCAGIVFVGEAPGQSEDVRGEPFVGAAGKRLSDALEKAGIAREMAYITNVVKCRPPDNRIPLQKERDACAGHLKNEIKIIGPAIICVMGNTAFGSLLGGSEIMRFHGKTFSKGGRLYFASLHPAATIYNRELIRTFEEDMRTLVRMSEKIRDGGSVKADYEVAA